MFTSPDYDLVYGQIYALKDPINIFYVGSTEQHLEGRLLRHQLDRLTRNTSVYNYWNALPDPKVVVIEKLEEIVSEKWSYDCQIKLQEGYGLII